MGSFEKMLSEFSNLSKEKYSDYAYSSGYFLGTLNGMFNRLSEKDQEFYVEYFQNSIESLKKENQSA